MQERNRSDMSGSGMALFIAVIAIMVAVFFGSITMMASNPEPGATGQPGLQEFNPDGSRGRTYVWYWPWQNPKEVQPPSQ